MEKDYEILRNKFFSASESGYKIPLGDNWLKFEEDICELAKVKNYFRKANKDFSKMIGDPRGFCAFMENTEKLVKGFSNNLANTAVKLIVEKDIYDISADDFLESRGKNKNHKSASDLLVEILEWKKTIGGKNSSDEFMDKMKYGLSFVKEIEINMERDVIDAMGIVDIPESNQQKALSILDNITRNIIPKNKQQAALTQAIQLYPLCVGLYNEGHNIFGNNNTQFNELERFMMMDSYIENINYITDDLLILPGEQKDNVDEDEDDDKDDEDEVDEDDDYDEAWDAWCEVMEKAMENFQIQAVYFQFNHDEKTKRKFHAATTSYAKAYLDDDDEYPLVCYDSTFFGACDEGCLLTTKGIYIYQSEYSQPGYYKYEDIYIESVKVSEGRGSNICINHLEFSSSMLGSDDNKNRFVELVKLFVLMGKKINN